MRSAHLDRECECGCACGYHLYGLGRCTLCAYSCWWFRLARPFARRIPKWAGVDTGEWSVVGFECGCVRYVDTKLLDPARLPRREDGWPLCPACGQDELADLANAQPRADAADLYCYACAALTVRGGAPVRPDLALRRALDEMSCPLPGHAGSTGVRVITA